MEQVTCKFCGQTVQSNFYYCPYCGKKLIQPPVTWVKELSVYLFSIILPPLGIFPALSYLFQKNSRARRVGLISLILTVIASLIMVWLSIAMINNINQTINKQLNSSSYLKNLGY